MKAEPECITHSVQSHAFVDSSIHYSSQLYSLICAALNELNTHTYTPRLTWLDWKTDHQLIIFHNSQGHLHPASWRAPQGMSWKTDSQVSEGPNLGQTFSLFHFIY